ncbi:MAG: tetratricopeptide repeat protein [Methanosarcinales archaeon]|nr:tetratricopeptide repeat protein [Methanosarcinales archaeon]
MYGPGASGEALDTAAQAYIIMGMNRSAQRLRRAAFKIDLESYWKGRISMGTEGRAIQLGDAQTFFRIKNLLEKYKTNIYNSEMDWWCFAQLAIAFRHLSRCSGRCEDESREYVRVAIDAHSDNNQKRFPLKNLGCSLLPCYHMLTLGALHLANSKKNGDEEAEKARATFKHIYEGIKKKEDNYITDYEHPHIGRGGRWEVYVIDLSHVLVEIGQLYLKRDPLEAACWFREAVSLLELDFPGEIKRLRLHALKSEALRRSDKYHSLKEARKGQILNPLDKEVGKMTGEAYCSLRDYDKATDYFKMVMSLDPDDPDILMDMGALQLKKAMDTRAEDERKAALKNALLSFEQAWKLYDRDNLTKRAEARYCIARTYMEMGEPEKAVLHLAVVYNAKYSDPEEKKKDPRWLLVGLMLGKAYLGMKAYDRARDLFRETAMEATERIKQTNNVVEDVGYYPTDSVHLGELLIHAKIYLARTYVAESVNTDRALRALQDVEDLISRLVSDWIADQNVNLTHMKMQHDPLDSLSTLEDIITDNNMAASSSLGRKLLSKLWECRGWALSNQYKIWGLDTLDNSIVLLEKSAGLRAHPLTYLHLAQVYEMKFNKTEDKLWLERAKAVYENAEDLDFKKENSEELKALKERLFGKEKPSDQGKDSTPTSTLKLDGTLGATLTYQEPKSKPNTEPDKEPEK